jgi:tetratricopeptide (TPR) repeat protein
MQICLGSMVTAVLLVGCATSQNKSASLAEEIDKSQAVRTASYQAESAEAASPKGVNDPLALKLRYAQWMEDIKNYNEAQAHYNVVLQENPQEVGAILGIARIDHIAGRTAKAEAGFKRALSLQPQSAITKNALGQFYATQQRWQEALPLLSEAMMIDSSNKVYRYHLAVALAKSGDEQTALSHFQQAVGDAPAYFNVGIILKQQGNYRKAEQYLLTALTKNPNLAAAQTALSEVRQQAQASETYSSQRRMTPQIQAAGHQVPQALSPAQQQQLQNQRFLSR